VYPFQAVSAPETASLLSIIPIVFTLLRTLLPSRKIQLVSFQAIPRSLQKTPGVAYTLSISLFTYRRFDPAKGILSLARPLATSFYCALLQSATISP